MTSQGARELPAGDAIEDACDRLCGIDVQTSRGRDGRRKRSRRYSRNMQAAWDLLLLEMPSCVGIQIDHSVDGWTCSLSGVDRGDREDDPWEASGKADTVPLAICRAFLDVRPDEPVESVRNPVTTTSGRHQSDILSLLRRVRSMTNGPERNEILGVIFPAIWGLPKGEWRILWLFYRLGDGPKRSWTNIAANTRLTVAQVRGIRDRALRRLRGEKVRSRVKPDAGFWGKDP